MGKLYRNFGTVYLPVLPKIPLLELIVYFWISADIDLLLRIHCAHLYGNIILYQGKGESWKLEERMGELLYCINALN